MIRGKHRTIKKPQPNLEIKTSIHNRFDIEVVDAKTGEIKQRAQAENIILNQLWTRLLTPQTYFSYIHYGTGTGTPDPTRTSLFTFLGSIVASGDTYLFDAKTGVASMKRKITLTETMAVGAALSEVGIGYSNTAATLCTHALLKDMNGNPIVINKTNTDIINIYATVFVHWDINGYSGVKIFPYNYNPLIFSLLGTQGPGVYYRYLISTAGGPMRASQFPNTFVSALSKLTAVVFSPAEKRLTFPVCRLAAEEANLTPGGASVLMVLGNNGSVQPIAYCPTNAAWFAGQDIVGEPIATGDGSLVDFDTDFRDISNLTVYVDGVAATVTVSEDYIPSALQSKMGMFFIPISIYQPTDEGNSYFVPECTSELTSSSMNSRKNAEYIYYNPNYAKGIASFLYQSYHVCDVYTSDDMITWTKIPATSASITVPTVNAYHKYWKFAHSASMGATEYHARDFVIKDAAPTKNIHFATPPASGAVITANYHTSMIAKDVNHVFDFSMVIQLGEYTT